MLLSPAKEIAIGLWGQLKSHCEICKVAGSIRREKPEVKDIEIVCLPKMVMGKDLFENDTVAVRSQEFDKTVSSLGEIVKGKFGGKYMQIKLKDWDIVLDLFTPDDFDFYRQFAIRTGSADWTSRYIAGGWKKIGWCGSDAGLRLQSQCEGKEGPDGKTKWRFNVPKAQEVLPPVWKSEKELFDWLKLKWVEPKNRNIG